MFGLELRFWLGCAWISYLLMWTLRHSGNGLNNWVPATNVGELDWISSFEVKPCCRHLKTKPVHGSQRMFSPFSASQMKNNEFIWKRFVYLLLKRQRERKSGRDLSTVGSFSKCPQQQVHVLYCNLSCWFQEPKYLDHHLLLPKCISKNPDQKWRVARIQNSSWYGI